MMIKKLFISLALSAILLVPSISRADINNAIGADFVSLTRGVLTLTFEQKISDKGSFTLFTPYFGYNDWAGIGIGASYRFYLFTNSTKAIEGFSFGPTFQVSFLNNTGPNDYSSKTAFILGGEASYKWVIGGVFEIEPNVHITFPVNTVEHLDYRAWWGGITLGYAW